MNKKKVVLPSLIVFTVAASLVSCSKKEAVDPYAVEINKPMMIADENPNDEFFSWTPVKGADGYLIKVDDGEEQGIGNPIHVNEDGFDICYYVMNLDALEEGEHKVQFAAYVKDKVSEWTDLQTIIVKKEVKVKLSRPALNSSLVFIAENDIDKVEFDFGAGIKANVSVNALNVENYGDDQIRVVGDPELLGVADKLRYGDVYTVTVRTSRKGEQSEISNPVSYTFNNKFYNKLTAPTIVFGSVIFDEEVNHPSLTIKLNDKEYPLVLNESNCLNVSIENIVGELLEKDLIKASDLYDKDELTVAVKVNFDDSHYKGTEYSNTYTMNLNIVDEDLAEEIFNSFDSSINKTEVMADVKVGEIGDFVTISAKIDDKDVSLITLDTKISSQNHRVATAKYENGAKEIIFTVAYKRGEFTKSKEFKVSLSNTKDIKVINLKANGSVLSWEVLGDYSLLDNKFIVEVKKGESTESIETSSDSIDLKDVKVSGEFSVTVYAVYNNVKLVDSASLSLTLKRNTASSSIYFSYGSYTVPKNNKLIAYDSNGNKQTYVAGASLTIQNLTNYVKLELIELGDGITRLDSVPSVFVISNKRATDLVYTIEDSKYLVLRDYKPSQILSSTYSSYIIGEGEDEKFDLAAYFDNSNTDLQIGKSSLELSASKVNYVLIDSVSRSDFHFAPNIEYTTTKDYGRESIVFTANSLYYGNYEVIVSKLDEKTGDYVRVDTLSKDSTNLTSINMLNAEVGIYQIKVRALGHGDVIAGSYSAVQYIANENKIEIDQVVVENNYTNVYFKNDFNLTYRYKWVSSENYNYTLSNTYLILNNSYTNLYLKSVNSTNGYVRYLPTASFTISEINTSEGSVKKVGNVSPEIPYGLFSSTTISSPYLYQSSSYTIWNYAEQAGAFVVGKKVNEEQVEEDIKKEFVAVSIDLGTQYIASRYYIGNYNSYTSYRPTNVIVEKDQPLLEQLEKAVHLSTTNEALLKALSWYVVTPSTDPENPEDVETLLAADVVATENMTLKLKKDESFTTYAYSLQMDGVSPSLLELRIYADGRVTRGGSDIDVEFDGNDKFTYENAIYALDKTNHKYGPWVPEGNETRYTCQPELLEQMKAMYEQVCETYGVDSVDAQQAKLMVDLLENAIFVEYEEYIKVLVKNSFDEEIHTATYHYDITTKSITHEGLTWVFLPDTNYFIIQMV